MTSGELVKEYLSDVRQLHNLHENDFMDRWELDARIEALDTRLFNDLEMISLVPSTQELEKLLAYSEAV
jgi:hypothetical protein